MIPLFSRDTLLWRHVQVYLRNLNDNKAILGDVWLIRIQTKVCFRKSKSYRPCDKWANLRVKEIAEMLFLHEQVLWVGTQLKYNLVLTKNQDKNTNSHITF